MIGHRTRFRENDDLPHWRGPAAKKKPPVFNERALITREIMRSREAQSNIDRSVKIRKLYNVYNLTPFNKFARKCSTP